MATSSKHDRKIEARLVAISALDAEIARVSRFRDNNWPKEALRHEIRTDRIARRFTARFGSKAAYARATELETKVSRLGGDWPTADQKSLDHWEYYSQCLYNY